MFRVLEKLQRQPRRSLFFTLHNVHQSTKPHTFAMENRLGDLRHGALIRKF